MSGEFTREDRKEAMRHAIDLLTTEAEESGNWDRVGALTALYEKLYDEPVER